MDMNNLFIDFQIFVIILYTIYRIIKVIADAVSSKYRYENVTKDVDKTLDIIKTYNDKTQEIDEEEKE